MSEQQQDTAAPSTKKTKRRTRTPDYRIVRSYAPDRARCVAALAAALSFSAVPRPTEPKQEG